MHSPKRKSASLNPGPSLMSRVQMGDYLHDLRNNRPHRPQASISSTPFPSHAQHYSLGRDLSNPSLPRLSQSSSDSDRIVCPPRSSSSLSQRHSLNLSVSTRSSFDDRRPSGYAERKERLKELAEARDVRLALEQMDLQDEQSIMTAAKKEADELVRRHKEADAPYRISQGPDGTTIRDASLSDPPVKPTELPSPPAQDFEAVSDAFPQIKKRSSYSKLADYWNNAGLANRRRSSGSRRSLSAKQKGIFANPDDKIYEDPAERVSPSVHATTSGRPAVVQSMPPAHVRRNPFARHRSIKQPLPLTRDTGKSSDGDPIHCSQVATNEAVLSGQPLAITPERADDDHIKYKGGIEVRSADLRAATSMRFKDRSAKLPSPTAVSDSPGRPIVSFKPDWTPPKVEDTPKATASRRPSPTPFHSPRTSSSSDVEEPIKAFSSSAVPTIGESRPPSIQINNGRMSPVMSIPKHPAADYRVPVIPVRTPHISISPPHSKYKDTPTVPSKNPSRTPITNPPAIVVEDSTSGTDERRIPQATSPKNGPPFRYSPFPKPRPSPTHSATAPVPKKQSWSAPVPRTTALCAQCALPISGKIVTAAGLRFHPSCFTCYHCGEGLECVDFYPEPAEERASRIDRIQTRINGELVEEREGASQTDDGDDSLRFYCHLDFHEFFSPRCKNCKTPIEGEVIVACGAEWHVGHFFCAQCGDPFDQFTPFVEKDGYAWCVECHTNRYSSKCKKCKRPVTSTVVQALGGEWHSECFCCTICSNPFEDGRFFLRAGTQDPVCLACEERRLKA